MSNHHSSTAPRRSRSVINVDDDDDDDNDEDNVLINSPRSAPRVTRQRRAHSTDTVFEIRQPARACSRSPDLVQPPVGPPPSSANNWFRPAAQRPKQNVVATARSFAPSLLPPVGGVEHHNNAAAAAFSGPTTTRTTTAAAATRHNNNITQQPHSRILPRQPAGGTPAAALQMARDMQNVPAVTAARRAMVADGAPLFIIGDAPTDFAAAALATADRRSRGIYRAVHRLWEAADRIVPQASMEQQMVSRLSRHKVTPEILEQRSNEFNRAVFAASPTETGLAGTHKWVNKLTPVCGACGIFVLDHVCPTPHHIGEKPVVNALRINATALAAQDYALLVKLGKIFTFRFEDGSGMPDVNVCIDPRAIINSDLHEDIVREAHKQAAPTDENAANFVYTVDDHGGEHGDGEDDEDEEGEDLFDSRYNNNNNSASAAAAASSSRRTRAATRRQPAVAESSSSSSSSPPLLTLPIEIVLSSPVVFFCLDCHNNIFGFKKPRTPQLCLASGFIPLGVQPLLPPLSDTEKLGVAKHRPYMTVVKLRLGTGNYDALHGHVFCFEHNSPEILANALSMRGKSPDHPFLSDVLQMIFVGTDIDLPAAKKALLDEHGKLKMALPAQVRLPRSNEMWSLTLRPHIVCAHLHALSRTDPDYRCFEFIDADETCKTLNEEMERIIARATFMEPSPLTKVVDLASVRHLESGIEHHQVLGGVPRNFSPAEAVAAVVKEVAPILEEARIRSNASMRAFNQALSDQVELRRQQHQQQQQAEGQHQQQQEQLLQEPHPDASHNADNIVGSAASAARLDLPTVDIPRDELAQALRTMLPPDVAAVASRAPHHQRHHPHPWPHDPVRTEGSTADHDEVFNNLDFADAQQPREFVYDQWKGTTEAMQRAAFEQQQLNNERGLSLNAIIERRARFLDDDQFYMPLDSVSPIPGPHNSESAARELCDVFLSHRGDKMVNDVDIVQWLPKTFPWYFSHGTAGLGPRKHVGKPKWVEKLLLHSGALFAFDPQFVMMLANRHQRMAVARCAALSVKIRPDQVKAFIELFADPAFVKSIDDALASDNKIKTEKIWRKMSTLLNVTYGAVPFSPAQRVGTLTDMFSLTNFFDSAALFVTFAPDDTNNALALKILRLNRNAHINMFSASPIAVFDHPDAVVVADERFVIPDELQRHKNRSYNIGMSPGIAAYVFFRLFDAVIQYLFYGGHRPSIGLNTTPGIFGIVQAHYFVFETQKRGSPHGHGAVIGPPSPALLHRCVDSPALHRLASDVMQSMICSEMPVITPPPTAQQCRARDYTAETICPPPDLAIRQQVLDSHKQFLEDIKNNVLTPEQMEEQQQQFGKSVFETSYTGLRGPFVMSSEFDRSVVFNAFRSQLHAHHRGCYPPGKCQCRHGYPCEVCVNAGPHEVFRVNRNADTAAERNKVYAVHVDDVAQAIPDLATERERLRAAIGELGTENALRQMCDPRVLVWLLPRSENDSWVVTYSPALSALLRSNNACYMLGVSGNAGNNTMFYMANYFCKEGNKPTQSLELISNVLKVNRVSTAEDASTDVGKWRFGLERLQNGLLGGMEVPSVISGSIAIGRSASDCSHELRWCFVNHMRNYLARAFGPAPPSAAALIVPSDAAPPAVQPQRKPRAKRQPQGNRPTAVDGQNDDDSDADELDDSLLDAVKGAYDVDEQD